MLSETSFLARSGVSLAAIRFCAAAIAASTAKLANRFHLGAGDLHLGGLYAAVEKFLQRLACLRSKGLCFRGGERDDVVHLQDDIGQLAPVVGEHLFRLFSEPARLLELLADQKRAGIERADDLLMDTEIDQYADDPASAAQVNRL
jgi:hypothetical protein